jgi:transcription elongation factor GreA
MQLPYRKPGKYSQIPTDNLMTKAKFDELQEKLKRLKSSQPQAARDVTRLAEMGDFSENVEYQLAKGRLRGINQNILKLEYDLEHAEIIEPKNSDTVQIGSTVKVESERGIAMYQILGSSETNPNKGVISHTSPLGEGLLGHKVGDTVTIYLAGKEVKYTLITLS